MAEVIIIVQDDKKDYLKDERLSWGGRGLLLTMIVLHKAEYTVEELARLSPDGIKATGIVLAELECCGYISRKPISPVDPETAIPNPEDMLNRPLEQEIDEKEQIQRLRQRLSLETFAERYSVNFVEAVFRELCRRDADFRRMMTDEAFGVVCFAVWEKLRCGPPCSASGLISMYLDHIMRGFGAAGGGGGNELPHLNIRDMKEQERILGV